MLRWFIQGLVILVPLGLTVYLFYLAFVTVDGWIPMNLPGLGIVLVCIAITIVGALGSTFVAKPLFRYFERLINRAPVFKAIYGSIRDLLTAFVGEEKKFNRPVWVNFSHEPGVKRLGFLTRNSLEELGLPKGWVAVYIPHSYNFSGNLVIVPEEWIEETGIPATDAMKFMVSGGVVGLHSNSENQKNKS